MSSSKHSNDRIRKAVQRRMREKGLIADGDGETIRLGKEDLSPTDPGDGRIIRKRLDDDYYEELYADD